MAERRNKPAGNADKKVLMRGMKPLCAKGVRSFYMAHYAMDHSTDASRHGFLEETYRRFIERRLRETFGFEGTPIEIAVRPREKRGR